MKTIIIALMMLVTITGFGQEMITKEVGDFHELKTFDLVFVRLIQADENKVIVKGPHSQDIKVINDDGVLKVRMHTDKRFFGQDTYIEVYAKKIDVIDANEGTVITINEVLTQPKIVLKTQEGAKIKGALKVDYASMRAVTGGIIEVNGTASIQEITLNTGGIYEGQHLHTKDTKLKITAAGEAEIFATDKAEVKVRAGGEVYIYGNPKELTKKKTFGGRITVVE